MKHIFSSKLIVVVLLLKATSSLAANSITPGALVLLPTFECLSVVAPFTGDANANATVAVQFRVHGSSTWLNAYAAYIDRRASVDGTDNSANINQARVSIVGLSPATTYDVQAIWSDTDGGGATVSATVTTLNNVPVNSGADIWVDATSGSDSGGNGSSGNPYKTITTAITHASAGSKIRVNTGTYTSFTMSTSGASNNYIRIVGEPGNTVVIDGTGQNQNLTLGSSLRWVSFENLVFNQSLRSGVVLDASQGYIWLIGCSFTNISKSATYGDAGILLSSGSVSNIFILNCSFSTGNSSSYANSVTDGIDFNDCGKTIVICSNYFGGVNGGGFRDNIGGVGRYGSYSTFANVEYCHNTFSGQNWDDGFEMDGPGNNMRIWDNTIICSNGNSCISIAPIEVGPAYVFRNRVSLPQAHQYAVKLGDGGPGPVYFFHNTVVVTGAGSDALDDSGGAPPSDLIIYKNNIFVMTGYAVYFGGRNNIYDYNLYWKTGTGNLIDGWNTYPDYSVGIYSTLAAWQAGAPPTEAHGLYQNPRLNGFLLTTNSPAVDAGLVLANFNDAASAWPFTGVAPDIGACEYVAGSNKPRIFLIGP